MRFYGVNFAAFREALEFLCIYLQSACVSRPDYWREFFFIFPAAWINILFLIVPYDWILWRGLLGFTTFLLIFISFIRLLNFSAHRLLKFAKIPKLLQQGQEVSEKLGTGSNRSLHAHLVTLIYLFKKTIFLPPIELLSFSFGRKICNSIYDFFYLALLRRKSARYLLWFLRRPKVTNFKKSLHFSFAVLYFQLSWNENSKAWQRKIIRTRIGKSQ